MVGGPSQLQVLLDGPGLIQAAGVGDAGQARLVEQLGYPAVYVGGAFVSYTRGLPDGTLTLTEMAGRMREIVDRVGVPVIADADDGFGDPSKVQRTVQEYERAGVAALHLEDMAVKKHGTLMPITEMVLRLKIAVAARGTAGPLIIARTDAVSPWQRGRGVPARDSDLAAFVRCRAYAEAGADLVMPLAAPAEWVLEFGSQIGVPLVLLSGPSLTAWDDETPELAPALESAELESHSVKVLVHATYMLVRMYGFMKSQYGEWLRRGRFDATPEDVAARTAVNELVGTPEKRAFLRSLDV